MTIFVFILFIIVLESLGKVSPKHQRDTYLASDPSFFLFRSKSMQQLDTDGAKRSQLAMREHRKIDRIFSGMGDGGSTFAEITDGSMKKITDELIEKCGLDHTALFLDNGHGLGKPSIFVAQYAGVCVASGVENEKMRYQVS